MRMGLGAFALIAAALVGASPGMAAPERPGSPAYSACMDQAAGVTSAMRDCAGAEYARLDKDLNAVYQRALARRDAPARVRLRVEERAWLKTRTAECRRRAAAEGGGTAALLVADSCELELTGRRIDHLTALAADAR